MNTQYNDVAAYLQKNYDNPRMITTHEIHQLSVDLTAKYGAPVSMALVRHYVTRYTEAHVDVKAKDVTSQDVWNKFSIRK